MARTNNLNNFLTDVADAIRTKKGTTNTILASDFDTEITSLPSGGGDIEEYFQTSGFGASSTMVKAVKKLPPMDMTGISGNNLFKDLSGLEEIPPMTNVNFNTLYYMFNGCSKITSIPQIDTSNATNMNNTFGNCSSLETIPQLNTSKVDIMNSTFSGCRVIHTIPELDAGVCVGVSSMFSSCSALENFGGLKDLGKAYLTTASANYSTYKLNLSSCSKLTHDSLMNVINNLYDIASLGVQVQTLQLGTTNINKLTEAELLIAQNKGWTVS